MKMIEIQDCDLKQCYELFNSFEQDEHGFQNDAYGLSFDEFKEFVNKCVNEANGIGLPDWKVPQSVYILEDGGKLVGIFKLRHYLTQVLKDGAGHIGYGIAKNYRGQGYATKGLAMILDVARKLVPEDEIYLSVHKDNPASLKVQMNNGAMIHHEDENEYYTRFKK